MHTYIKNGRKFAQSRNGESYPYWMVITTLVVTGVATILLMMFGIIFVAGEYDSMEISLGKEILTRVVGIVGLYAGYRISKIFYNIVMKF